MSMFSWLRRKPAKRYFVVSFWCFREEGLEFGAMRVVANAMPSKAALRATLVAAKGEDVGITGTMELPSEADLDAYFANAEPSEECHVRTLQ